MSDRHNLEKRSRLEQRSADLSRKHFTPWWSIALHRLHERWKNMPARPCEHCGFDYAVADDDDDFLSEPQPSEFDKQLRLWVVRKRAAIWRDPERHGVYEDPRHDTYHEVIAESASLAIQANFGADHPCAAVRLARWSNPSRFTNSLVVEFEHMALTEPDFDVRRAMWEHRSLTRRARAVLADEFSQTPDPDLAPASPCSTCGADYPGILEVEKHEAIREAAKCLREFRKTGVATLTLHRALHEVASINARMVEAGDGLYSRHPCPSVQESLAAR